MTPRKLALAAVLAGATTAPACAYIGTAHAQAPQCGGNSQVHPAPIDCINTKTVQGVRGSVRLVVDDAGHVMVTAVVQDLTPNTPLPPLFLQVKAHPGISSNPTFVGGTDVFDGNTASLELDMPRSLADNCTSQIDVKIAPGQPTLDHIDPVFRVAAPLVGIDLAYCQPVTVPSTAPTTAPVTTVPGTSSPTTNPAEGSTSPADVSTTDLPSSSVVGGTSTLPATGRGIGEGIGWAFALIIPGVCLLILVAAHRRVAS